jgi:DNA polymerase V
MKKSGTYYAIVDCNSFYCSCEKLFRPDLENKPVVVLSNNDGCIISRTDEAKALGVAQASPLYQNRAVIEKNNVTVFSSNYNLYGDLSLRVMDTLRSMAGENKVEVYSVDEAFVMMDDISPGKRKDFCRRMKERVERWSGIRVTIGAAPTKVLAKLANRLGKKDKQGTGGVMVLRSGDEIQVALEQTRVEDIWGVGRQFAVKLHHLGIDNGRQLRNMPDEWVRKNMGGVVGSRLINELRGISCIPMKDPLETKKMIATTRMFGSPVSTLREIREAVANYTARAAEKLRRQGSVAGSIDVYVVSNGRKEARYEYNPQSTHRFFTIPLATADTSELISYALPLVDSLFQEGLKYLKAGVILGNLGPNAAVQANLFGSGKEKDSRPLMEAIDNINFSHRGDLVRYLASGMERNWKMRQALRSGRYTSRWNELFELK